MRKVGMTYAVDLDLPPAQRWPHVAEVESKVVDELVRDVVPHLSRRASLEACLALCSDRPRLKKYIPEISSFATPRTSVAALVLMHLDYEGVESVVASPRRTLGCTSVVMDSRKYGLVHARNLDWPVASLGRSTRKFEFLRTNGHPYVTVGMPGFVGALSGMVPGEYSLTINYVCGGPARSKDSILLFLRDVFDECATYEEAKSMLCREYLSAGALFTLCGRRDACVVERTPKDHWVREKRAGEPLVVTNHYVARPGSPVLNFGRTSLELTTDDRFVIAGKTAGRLLGGEELARFRDVIDHPNIFCGITEQQMVFAPGTGELRAWARR